MSSGSAAPVVNLVEETRTKKQLLTNLIESVKSCQIRFGSRPELATEADSSVKKLCAAYEAVFLHGTKSVDTGKGKSWNLENIVPSLSSASTRGNFSRNFKTFWPLIVSVNSQTELQRFTHKTDVLKQRAWLRVSLNEHSLHRYILMILGDETLLNYYESWAFMLDGECNSALVSATAGLAPILFALRLDLQELDRDSSVNSEEGNRLPAEAKFVETADPEDQLAVKAQKKKKKKKVPTTFVSFDDEVSDELTKPVNISTPNIVQRKDKPVISIESDTGHVETRSIGPEDTASLDSTQAEDQVSNEITTNDNDNQSESSKIDSEQDSVSNVSISSSNYDFYYNPSNRLKPVDSVYQDSDHDLIPVNSSSTILNTSSSPNRSPVHHPSHFADSHDQTSIASSEVSSSGQLGKLKVLLDQQIQQFRQLQEQNSKQQTEFNDKMKMADVKIEGLLRENEILKHQLKMKAMSTFTDSTNTTTDSTDDERKLIQVAEMHGELLDFNSYLQSVLKAKEAEIEKLKAELTELVGVNSGSPSSTCSSPARVLINIWIPSAFLTGSANDIHHVYQVFVRIRDTEWNVYRRYSQFHALHQQLSKSSTEVASFPFPPKKRNKTKYVEERRRKLQDYLRCVMNWLLDENKVLSDHPGKELLIGLMPFFGEQMTSNCKPRQKKSSLFFSSKSRTNATPHYPTYTGL